MAHKDRVLARVQEIGGLKNSAVAKLGDSILNQAAQKMESKLGDANYGNYVRMFTENSYESDDTYDSMEDGQKKLFTLESAEAYYTLYFLALALKDMDKGNVIFDTSTFGEGKIDPSSIENLIDLRNQFLYEGNRLISSSGKGNVRFSAI